MRMGNEDNNLGVVGCNTADGALHMWRAENEEWANSFAKQLCEDTGEPVFIVRVVGVWKPVKRPVEYVPVEPKETPND